MAAPKSFLQHCRIFFWSNIRNKFCSSEVLLDNYYISNVVLWAYCISIIKHPRGVASYKKKGSTVHILCLGTDRSQQTVQTKIRLLLKKQSDQGFTLFAIPSASFGCINAMLHQTFLFLGQLWQLFEVSQILEFSGYLVFKLQ